VPASRQKPPHDPVTAYAKRVVDGEVPSNRLHKLAAARHLKDIATQQTAAFPYYLDLEEVHRRVEFFMWLRHFKGKYAGQPIRLEPWQQFIVGSSFGWKHVETGLRRFRTAYKEVPRKNGKSIIESGLAISLAFFDNEPGAEVVCAATKKDQAQIVFGGSKTLVRQSPQLSKRIGAFKNSLHIVSKEQSLRPLGADADTLDGLNIHGAVVDEVHAHRTRAMVDVLDTATGAREQPFIDYITTAGFDQRSVCWQLRTYSVQVLEGLWSDETWFAFITGIDDGDDWMQESSWQKANPNYGVSVSADDLRRKVNRAMRSPEELPSFLCKHLNVWTQAAGKAVDLSRWDTPENTGPVGWLDLRDRCRSKPCVVGLDLANTTDIAAAVFLFDQPDASIAVVPFFWIPEERLRDRVRRDRVPYDVWLEMGAIEATPGPIIDYRYIQQRLNHLGKEVYVVKEIGFDPWNAVQLATDLGPDGDGFQVVMVRQGTRNLNEPTKAFLDRITAGTVRHGGHPVLRWMVSNLVLKTDPAGNVMPDKERSIEKIDGVSALVTGLFCVHRSPAPKASVYATRGAISFEDGTLGGWDATVG
jgi:phage terminase large subunit-like protein